MRFVTAALATIITAVLLSSPANATGAAPIPENDPFFEPPADVAQLEPGDIVRVRTVQVKAFELPIPVDAWQILYRTSDRRDRPTVTATTLIVPRAAWRGSGPRPVVSYQTAEDGVSTRCAPSYALTAGLRGGYTGSYSEGPVVIAAVMQGWAVSVPDYEGMESQFLVADVAGKAILDGLRAVRDFTEIDLSDSPAAIWGYSGGAFATAAAAQMQESYAPELNIVAVSLGGLLGDVRATIDAFDGSVAGSAVPMGMHGIDRAYPELQIRERLNPLGQRLFEQTADLCLFEAVVVRPFLTVAQIEAEPGMLDRPEVAAVLQENSPMMRAGTPMAPVYEYHALFDEFAPIEPAQRVLRNYCDAGVDVQHQTTLLGEHLTEIVLGIPGALNFLNQRFADKPAKNTCARVPR